MNTFLYEYLREIRRCQMVRGPSQMDFARKLDVTFLEKTAMKKFVRTRLDRQLAKLTQFQRKNVDAVQTRYKAYGTTLKTEGRWVTLPGRFIGRSFALFLQTRLVIFYEMTRVWAALYRYVRQEKAWLHYGQLSAKAWGYFGVKGTARYVFFYLVGWRWLGIEMAIVLFRTARQCLAFEKKVRTHGQKTPPFSQPSLKQRPYQTFGEGFQYWKFILFLFGRDRALTISKQFETRVSGLKQKSSPPGKK